MVRLLWLEFFYAHLRSMFSSHASPRCSTWWAKGLLGNTKKPKTKWCAPISMTSPMHELFALIQTDAGNFRGGIPPQFVRELGVRAAAN